MGAMGASSAMIAITSIAFAVTGISAKINEAAAGVFGEDLVKIGSLFGAAYGAIGGGFGVGAGADVGTANALSDASYAGADWSAAGMPSLADMGQSALEGVGIPGATEAAADFANQSDAIAQMGGDAGEFNLSAMGQTNPTQTMGSGPSPIDIANQTQQPQSLIPTTGAVSAQASGVDAAGTQAAGARAAGTQAAGQSATAAIQAPGSLAPVSPGAAAGGRSFFDKLIFDDKGNVSSGAMRMGGQVLGGIGQGYQAAQIQKEKQRQFDAQMAMYNQRPTTRATQ